MRKPLISLLSLCLVVFTFLTVEGGQTVYAANNGKFRAALVQKVLPISYDNEVKSDFPTQVFSSSPYACVGHWDFYNSTMRYYLYPDLSGLPEKAKISEAALYIDRASSSWDQDGQYQLYMVKQDWNTNSLSWNSQPQVSDGYVTENRLQYDIYKFVVTNWIKQALANPKVYHGFMLRKPIETGNNNGLFATADYPLGGSQTRPYLMVTYSVR